MKQCPKCKNSIKQLNPRHIKNCFGQDPSYKYQYIIHNYPDLTEKTLTKLYVSEKWSTNMIKDRFLIDLKSVCYMLNYYGIQIRTIRETRQLNEYKQRIQSTNIERFGAVNPLSKGTVPHANRNKTVLDRYGCENVFQQLDLFIDDWSNKGKRLKKISSLNLKLYSILDEMHIAYKPEHSISYIGENGKKRWKSYDALVGDLLIEVNGDYWHANPTKYKEDDVFQFPKSTMSAKDIWYLDIYKKDIAESHGYRIITIWENELKENEDEVRQRIKDKIYQKGKI